jgi:hypothetical protein
LPGQIDEEDESVDADDMVGLAAVSVMGVTAVDANSLNENASTAPAGSAAVSISHGSQMAALAAVSAPIFTANLTTNGYQESVKRRNPLFSDKASAARAYNRTSYLADGPIGDSSSDPASSALLLPNETPTPRSHPKRWSQVGTRHGMPSAMAMFAATGSSSLDSNAAYSQSNDLEETDDLDHRASIFGMPSLPTTVNTALRADNDAEL